MKCPNCKVFCIETEFSDDHDYKFKCPSCGWDESQSTNEMNRWNALTVNQKLDELKARLDNMEPAIQAAWMHVPLK